VRSALGCAALGLLLLLVAGTLDAEPLYVTGAALMLLGTGAAAWIGLGAWGAQVQRTVSKRSVVEEEPLPIRIEVTRGRLPLPPGWIDEPLLTEPVRLTAGSARARVRVNVTFGRRGPAHPAATQARPARPVRAGRAGFGRRALRRAHGVAARAARARHGRRRGRRQRARARRAHRRRRDGDRRPARAP
jgi:uncharacterized protein (DUF58 family)